MRLKQGLVEVPAGVALTDFLLHDGRPPKPAPPEAAFGAIRDAYLDAQRRGPMEGTSLKTVEQVLGRFEGFLGNAFPLGRLALADLQRYVDWRARSEYR